MAPSAIDSVSRLPLKVVPTKNGTSDGLINLKFEGAELNNRVLKTFRCLIADLCEQFKGGHPGSAMGMAAIGVALWKYTMKYSPENPNFFNRDRFVLSNGKFHQSPISYANADDIKATHACFNIRSCTLSDTRI
jgi:dihydroxyacetone synthase